MREVLTLDRLQAMGVDDAAALLAYRRADGAADLDAQVLAAWLRLDPTNAAAWEAARAAWSDFDGAADDEILAALRDDAREAGPSRARWRSRAAAAAAVVLLAVAGAMGIAHRPWEHGQGRPESMARAPALTFANAAGAPRDFQLPDGTRMTLAAGSSATASVNARRRDVRLARGRAFFIVAHDARRPFAVRAAGQEIVALGTQFDVQVQPGEIRVILTEGRVSVRSTAGGLRSTVLRPGQQLVAREGEPPQVTSADLQEERAWRERFVVFNNVTLGEAALELNGQGAGRLIVRDPAVAAMRVSGRFNAVDLPRFGRSIAELRPVRLVQTGPAEWEIVAAR